MALNLGEELIEFELCKKECWKVQAILRQYFRNGKTLEQFLFDFDITMGEWNCFLKKNKKLKKFIVDCQPFYKAYWQQEASTLMKKHGINQSIARLILKNALGWSESAANDIEPPKEYKVVFNFSHKKPSAEQIIAERKDKEIKKFLRTAKEKGIDLNELLGKNAAGDTSNKSNKDIVRK